MPDIPAASELLDEEPLITLLEAARMTQRPLRVIQSWTQGDNPILPVARQDEHGRRTKWIRLVDLRATASRRKWGTKRTKARATTSDAGLIIEIRGQEATDSRLPETH